jgi:O-acetyl-ADP-ribose deacetylase
MAESAPAGPRMVRGLHPWAVLLQMGTIRYSKENLTASCAAGVGKSFLKRWGMREITIGNSRLQFLVGDITAQDTQAVVNAANERLAPGGGVAGAIHRAAGPELWTECSGLGGCSTGEAKITGGYNLPNQFVIHTVGPVYSGTDQDPILLRSCYLSCLKLADEKGIASISFPALSTGIFGYPVEAAARVAIMAFRDYLSGDTGIRLVRMVLYDRSAYDAHVRALEELEKAGGLS